MIVVVGLAFEARIAAASGLQVICGGDGRDLVPSLHGAIAPGCRGLISFGVAGGLTPELRPGTCIVGSEVVAGDIRLATDSKWSQKLLQAIPDAVSGVLAGAIGPVTTPAAKHALRLASDAIAVDTESHIVAAAAARHGLPMAAIRVICDPLARTLPDVALRALRPDGSTDIVALLRSIVRQPGCVPELLRIAIDARAARATLLRCRHLLGPEPDFVGKEASRDNELDGVSSGLDSVPG
jgi:hopanoid-associated phosphorylase